MVAGVSLQQMYLRPTSPLVTLVLLALCFVVPSGAQDHATTTARILGDIPDGSPPTATPPKPVFVPMRGDILATTTRVQGGRTITIREIKPIALPPPPQPVQADTWQAMEDPALRDRLAEFAATHPQMAVVRIGATVYRSKDAPPRSLVRYWPGPGAESISFWSSADFSLLAGIGSFVGTDERSRMLVMACGNRNADGPAESSLLKEDHEVDAIPKFPEDKATFALVDAPPADARVLVPIQSLHDIYNSEFTRLKAAAVGREQARIQREADLLANPPRPKDITLNYWRSEKPAASTKGAGPQ